MQHFSCREHYREVNHLSHSVSSEVKSPLPSNFPPLFVWTLTSWDPEWLPHLSKRRGNLSPSFQCCHCQNGGIPYLLDLFVTGLLSQGPQGYTLLSPCSLCISSEFMHLLSLEFLWETFPCIFQRAGKPSSHQDLHLSLEYPSIKEYSFTKNIHLKLFILLYGSSSSYINQEFFYSLPHSPEELKSKLQIQVEANHNFVSTPLSKLWEGFKAGKILMKTGPVTAKTQCELSWLHPVSLTCHDLQRNIFPCKREHFPFSVPYHTSRTTLQYLSASQSIMHLILMTSLWGMEVP